MTLAARPCPKAHWPALIKRVYAGDTCLLVRNHVCAPCELAAAVADTYLTLRDQMAPDFVLYAVHAGSEQVGMIGVEPGSNCLVTFGLGVAHRNAAHARELAALCRNLLQPGRAAHCALYRKNIPARRFVRRMGFVPSLTPLLHPLTNQVGILYTLYS